MHAPKEEWRSKTAGQAIRDSKMKSKQFKNPNMLRESKIKIINKEKTDMVSEADETRKSQAVENSKRGMIADLSRTFSSALTNKGRTFLKKGTKAP
jgi:hypothetical protein